MIFCPKDGILEAHLAPLGGHLAPEGFVGGLRTKNVDFPMGKSHFFKIRIPALVRVMILKTQKRAKNDKKIFKF